MTVSSILWWQCGRYGRAPVLLELEELEGSPERTVAPIFHLEIRFLTEALQTLLVVSWCRYYILFSSPILEMHISSATTAVLVRGVLTRSLHFFVYLLILFNAIQYGR